MAGNIEAVFLTPLVHSPYYLVIASFIWVGGMVGIMKTMPHVALELFLPRKCTWGKLNTLLHSTGLHIQYLPLLLSHLPSTLTQNYHFITSPTTVFLPTTSSATFHPLSLVHLLILWRHGIFPTMMILLHGVLHDRKRGRKFIAKV